MDERGGRKGKVNGRKAKGGRNKNPLQIGLITGLTQY